MSILPDATQHLTERESETAFGKLLDGETSEEEIASFLIALSDRGETSDEIAGAAKAYGNRAASSKAGAADTLEALGLDMEAAGKTAEKTLAEIGICFLFAKNHHPAMGRIQPIRQRIGRRTIFNLMGPLSNPAGVKRQLIGIARPAYVPIYAGAKARLGTERTLIVSGDEGLDELSLAGGNEVADVRGNDFEMQRLDCDVAGLPHAPVEAIRGGDATHNAAALKSLLSGTPGPYRDAVLFNAAAVLLVAGKGQDWVDLVAMSAEAIDSGRAADILARWIQLAR
jgi:anthranilate phosphoribosyltransferase